MKTIGLIGGMSWESTAIYYRRLNQIARERLGGQHSASLLLRSVDFAHIAASQAKGDWDDLTGQMIVHARGLEAGGAQAVLICANTMHLMAEAVQLAINVPLIHVADVTAVAIKAVGVKRPLLLATRFTMEEPFYRERLKQAGVEAILPGKPDRARLHAIIYDELVQGRFEPASRGALVEMTEAAARDDGADGVIFGCTEIGLLVEQANVSLPVFDTTELHAQSAMDFALG